MKLTETEPFLLGACWKIGSEKQRSVHRCGDCGADEAVEPVVVGLFGAGLQLIDGAAAALGFDEIFGGDLFGKHAMLFRSIAENGKAAAVAHCHGEPRVCK